MYTFKIIMLGPRGSGKTVFLASMYHYLSIMGEYGFRLQVEGKDEDEASENQKRLHNYYTEVATGEEWLPGTRGITEWIFTCYVKAENGRDEYPACRFSYLDYDGLNTTEIGQYREESEEPETFAQKLTQADVLLGLLDGMKINDLMLGRNQKELNAWRTKDLANMLSYMQKHRGPIHFAISKWDILENQFNLGKIRHKLLEIPNFQKLVKDKNNSYCPVRLIPVSSVGKGFACPVLLANGDMEMKKFINNRSPEPFNVEMPLAFIDRDLVYSQINELIKDRDMLRIIRDEIKANPKYNWWDRAARFGAISTVAFREIFVVNPNTPVIDKIIKRGINVILHKTMEKETKAEQELKESKDKKTKSIEEKETQEIALDLMIKKFQALQESLKSKYPESDLSDQP
ncbi:hypothetical protein [Argonema galeatum]|uniref:hypothetical protein n=1 Tax=Argonema galeatum TaxID=2942762 RepID=UPI002012E0C4|nr:hypothetical protein [Argonema galeatum]MCL1464525.1 hypothetical protein [Argonema galeatum A003/A1]